MPAFMRYSAGFIWLQICSEKNLLRIYQWGFVLYLVPVYTLRNERNNFVCYSKILQDWMHCCVCGEVREEFNILTINNCILLHYLHSLSVCLSHGGGKAELLLALQRRYTLTTQNTKCLQTKVQQLAIVQMFIRSK